MSSSVRNRNERRSFANWPAPPVRADSLRQQVFEIVRDAIFAGTIQPGDVLRELQLAKTMKVSQSTVREALSQLEHVGLVVRQPNRSTMVTSLGDKEIRDRLKIRLALEELAIAEAALQIADPDLAELGTLAGFITAAIVEDSYFELGQADRAFHRRIWEASGNPLLYQALDGITTPLFAFLGVLQKKAGISLQATRAHEPVIEALRTREPEEARAAIRHHILSSYGSIIDDSRETTEESQPSPAGAPGGRGAVADRRGRTAHNPHRPRKP
jgi:DNA-binding GntR family transcriptional regulator